ncbi:ribonucleoside triphosphate reductase [Candidatus Dojkabacteria bacterium]|nr:ribonucleoside triphosphate reductase [Candidatus Dojkabacteria bacterium]
MSPLDSKKKIEKRDGQIVNFDRSKIIVAIQKAMRAVGFKDFRKADTVATDVEKELKKDYFDKSKIPTVENIQDLVEKYLILNRLPDVAKSYILYRDLHSRIRNINDFVDIATLTEEYINTSDWKTKENSSIDYSLSGLYNHIQRTIGEIYWLNRIFDEEIRKLNENNDFHIHKLAAISAYCAGWDLMDLLVSGFGGVPRKLSCSPPKHFSTALSQLVNFLFTLSNETPEGAVAVSSLDTLIAPFIYYDKLTEKQVHQHIQEFIFNINVPTKVGGQAPFTNVTLDLECPSHLKEEPVVIGGKTMDRKYGEFQKEMDMFNKHFAQVIMAGDSSGRVFSFPIPTYNITKDFNWDNKILNPIWEMTAKYGTPYFANFVNSDMHPDDVRSMCCRLQIDKRELQKRGGGYFGANPLTGSIGYVTINLPRLGYLYKGKKKELYERLEYLMEKAAESLIIKRKTLEKLTDQGLYPYSKHYLRSVKQRTGEYWGNHFNTIGIIGMNECCLNYNGKDLTTKEGQTFAIEMIDFMNQKLKEFQKEHGQMYNLEASPAEGTSYRLARADKKKYSDIIVANEKDYQENGAEPYYTNSTQLPVGFTDDIFSALDLQDELQSKYTGGTVFHGFLGERLPDIATTKSLVKKISKHYRLPYFTITPTFSICPEDGYLSGEVWTCPKCQGECEVYSRIVGKIHPVQNWNAGKRSEFKERRTFQSC